jgi:protein-S-isoprenylcysteine O-methyltransferase Ste14
VSDGGLPAHAPRPGDPRDPGPRPPARGRDLLWLGLAIVLVGVTAVQFAVLARALATGAMPPVSGGGLLLGFAFTVVWLLTIAWFSLGSWRRTVWGCPFAHTHDAPAARRCVRHELIDPGSSDPDDPTVR